MPLHDVLSQPVSAGCLKYPRLLFLAGGPAPGHGAMLPHQAQAHGHPPVLVVHSRWEMEGERGGKLWGWLWIDEIKAAGTGVVVLAVPSAATRSGQRGASTGPEHGWGGCGGSAGMLCPKSATNTRSCWQAHRKGHASHPPPTPGAFQPELPC